MADGLSNLSSVAYGKGKKKVQLADQDDAKPAPKRKLPKAMKRKKG